MKGAPECREQEWLPFPYIQHGGAFHIQNNTQNKQTFSLDQLMHSRSGHLILIFLYNGLNCITDWFDRFPANYLYLSINYFKLTILIIIKTRLIIWA